MSHGINRKNRHSNPPLTHTHKHTHTHTHHLLTHAHTSASAVFESKPFAALQTARDHKQAGTKRWPWLCVVRRNKHTCPATATEITTTSTTTSGVWGDGEADAACCCVVLCARAAARRHRVFIRDSHRNSRGGNEAVALGDSVQHQQRHVKAALVHTRRAQAVMAAAGAAGLQSILTRLSTCVVRGRWKKGAIKSNTQLYQHRPTWLRASTHSPPTHPLTSGTHGVVHECGRCIDNGPKRALPHRLALRLNGVCWGKVRLDSFNE